MTVPAFDHSGMVDVVDFDFDALDDPEPEPSPSPPASAPPSEVAIQLLRLLCSKGATRQQIGARTLLLLYVLRQGDFKSQAELARRMGISRQRVKQSLDKLRRDFPMFATLS